MRCRVRSVLLVTCLILGANACAARVRIYDPAYHDYHRWDDREERAYRGYLVEQHREYRNFRTLSNSEQTEYWDWRHKHPDAK
jgi:hypothetical protein